MTGVLLVNMGGPGSEQEMKSFLARMFRDKRILPYNIITRSILAWIISTARYEKSWKKYELIGGTPIIKATGQSVLALQKALNNEYSVKMGFSYSSPTIKESILAFKQEGIKKITIIPLYPQSSFSTTGSVMDDVRRILAKDDTLDIRIVKYFFRHVDFVNFWSENIADHIKSQGISSPYLLFSAHSIPRYMVDQGDTYPKEIEESAALIAGKLGLDFEVTYQSGMGRVKWIGPDVKDSLKSLAGAAKEGIVIVPISFVNENLETLYDIDQVIIPYAKQTLGIVNISRVKIPEADKTFIRLLLDIVKK